MRLVKRPNPALDGQFDFEGSVKYILSMLLAIDIGNSKTHFGIYNAVRPVKRPDSAIDELVQTFNLHSNRKLDTDKCMQLVKEQLAKAGLDALRIDRVGIASVVPNLTSVYQEIAEKLFCVSPLIISSGLKLPIKIGYDEPSQLGADRIANAVAGFAKFGGPLIIVDYGTAINFEVITDNGIFIGGVIAPGPETSLAGLTAKAAQLFEVRIEEPSRSIAKDTENAIKSGLFYGTIGQVDGIIKTILDELTVPARVVATGGLSHFFAPHSAYIKSVHPNLTLDGIRIIVNHQSV